MYGSSGCWDAEEVGPWGPKTQSCGEGLKRLGLGDLDSRLWGRFEEAGPWGLRLKVVGEV